MSPVDSGRRRRVRFLALAVAFALATVACGATDDPEPRPIATSTKDPGADPPALPSFPMPDTPVGRQAQWIVDVVSDEAWPMPEELEEHLAPDASDEAMAALNDTRADGPFYAVDLDVVGSEAVLRLRPAPRPGPSASPPEDAAPLSTAAGYSPGDWRALFHVDDSGRIDRLTLEPDDGVPDPTTWAELLELLTWYDADVGLYAARVVDGRCEPIAAVDPDRPMPVASTFKLWVLEAVARAVERGAASWSQRLTVDDDVRSLPSGRLQDEPNGHQVSLSQTAAGMIAISDNTAADMLIRAVGRDAVEETMRETGHGSPELNTPLLTTREFFTIGWSPGDALLDAWRQAGGDAAARRAVLEDVPAGALTVTADDVDEPVWPDGVGWFASAEDVCRVFVALHDRPPGDPDAEMLRTILGHNRGTEIDEATFPYVAFKGGSARGVLAASWFAERADGETFVVAVQAAADSADAVRAQTRFYDVGRYAFELLAGEQAGPS